MFKLFDLWDEYTGCAGVCSLYTYWSLLIFGTPGAYDQCIESGKDEKYYQYHKKSFSFGIGRNIKSKKTDTGYCFLLHINFL